MKGSSGLLAVALIAGSVFMFAANRNGGQSPEREPQGSSEISEAFSVEQKLLTAAIEQAVVELKAGNLKTDKEARDWLKAARDAAKVKAWEPVARKDQEVLGDGKWSPELHAKRLQEMIR